MEFGLIGLINIGVQMVLRGWSIFVALVLTNILVFTFGNLSPAAMNHIRSSFFHGQHWSWTFSYSFFVFVILALWTYNRFLYFLSNKHSRFSHRWTALTLSTLLAIVLLSVFSPAAGAVPLVSNGVFAVLHALIVYGVVEARLKALEVAQPGNDCE